MSGSRAFVGIVAVVAAAYVAPIRAEVIGPLLPRMAIEIGVMARETDRSVERAGQARRFTQTELPVTIRYGISTTATLSFELDANPYNIDEVFYTVGASIQALIWRVNGYAITIGASYARTLAIDAAEPDYMWSEQRLDWTLLGQRSFDVGSQELDVWLGPLVSYMHVTPQAPAPELFYESEALLGVVVGTGLLLVDHIVLQGALVWIDEPEYRINLAYRF